MLNDISDKEIAAARMVMQQKAEESQQAKATDAALTTSAVSQAPVAEPQQPMDRIIVSIPRNCVGITCHVTQSAGVQSPSPPRPVSTLATIPATPAVSAASAATQLSNLIAPGKTPPTLTEIEHFFNTNQAVAKAIHKKEEHRATILREIEERRKRAEEMQNNDNEDSDSDTPEAKRQRLTDQYEELTSSVEDTSVHDTIAINQFVVIQNPAATEKLGLAWIRREPDAIEAEYRVSIARSSGIIAAGYYVIERKYIMMLYTTYRAQLKPGTGHTPSQRSIEDQAALCNRAKSSSLIQKEYESANGQRM